MTEDFLIKYPPRDYSNVVYLQILKDHGNDFSVKFLVSLYDIVIANNPSFIEQGVTAEKWYLWSKNSPDTTFKFLTEKTRDPFSLDSMQIKKEYEPVIRKILMKSGEYWSNSLSTLQNYQRQVNAWRVYLERLERFFREWLLRTLPVYHYKRDWKEKGIDVPKHPNFISKNAKLLGLRMSFESTSEYINKDAIDIGMKPFSFKYLWDTYIEKYLDIELRMKEVAERRYKEKYG